MLGVRVSRAITKNDLDAFIAKVVEAFAYVEGVESVEMKRLLAPNQQSADNERTLGMVFKRNYTDPDYPEKLDRALRREPPEVSAERVH